MNRRRRLVAELDFERGARAHQTRVLEQIGDLTGLGHGVPKRYTPDLVLSAVRRLVEQLERQRDRYLAEVFSRHREADYWRGQLLDLCSHEGIDPGSDPHAALLAHLRRQAGEDLHDHPPGESCGGLGHPEVRS